MLKNLKLGTKLILAFMSVAVITLMLGTVGYYGAVKSESTITDLASVHLPSVDNLLGINTEAERVRGSLRSLAIAGLPTDIRLRQYDNIVKSQNNLEKMWNAFEALPKTTEEMNCWKQFCTTWKHGRQKRQSP
jgi:methyl-accepting chemotaxis protein